jgi:hypothetical protein
MGAVIRRLAWGLGLAAMVVVPNVVVRDVRAQVDLTGNSRNTLSGTTRDALRALDHDVHLLGLFRRDNPDRQQAKELMDRYRSVSSRVKVELVDPDTQPSVALQAGVGDGTVLVVDGDRVEEAGSLNEYGLSTALWRAVHAERVHLCVTTGHGERAFDDDSPSGYDTLRRTMVSHGVTVEPVNLIQTSDVPQRCQALVMASPRTPLTAGEQAALERYRLASGRFLVLLDPDSAVPEELLGRFQLQSPPKRVLDAASAVEGDPGSLLIKEYPSANPITKGLPPTAVFDARAVVAPAVEELRSGLWASRLLGVSADAKFDDGSRLPEHAVLGAAVDDSRISDRSRIARTRLVLIGDGDFASNLFIEVLSGGALFIRSVAWLSQAEELATISFRPSDQRTVYLSRSEAGIVRWASYGLMPALFLGGALGLAARRAARRRLDEERS